MSGKGEAENEGSRQGKVQLPWEKEGHFAERVRSRRAPAEIQAIIDREMGRHKLTGSGTAPALFVSPVANNPYYALVLGILAVAVPFAVGTMTQSVELFLSLFLAIGLLGCLIIVFAALRVRRWHRARAAVRAHLSVNGGTFPEELRWYT